LHLEGKTVAQLPQPVTARGEATRKKLLDAAELEFGEKGFHAASVSSITTRAGVGQGTFYLYFPSKEAILSELVVYMGRMLRHALAQAIEGLSKRLDIEQRGLEAFVSFCLAHKNLYRVVMEAQFVDESAFKKYYQDLAQAYIVGLKRALDDGQILGNDPEAVAWALMGIGHFLGLRYAVWQDVIPSKDVMAATFHFIKYGLVGR
jgi:AcrR family transcriptional regulator